MMPDIRTTELGDRKQRYDHSDDSIVRRLKLNFTGLQDVCGVDTILQGNKYMEIWHAGQSRANDGSYRIVAMQC
jgi:hypothetical protein